LSKNGEILRKIAKEKFGSANKMADELGMGHVTLNQYITGKRNIGMKTLQKLASIGIDTSVFDFMSQGRKFKSYLQNKYLSHS